MANADPLYSQLATLLVAIANCRKANNLEWWGKHSDRLVALVKDRMPSGSGFDTGTKLDDEKSTPNKLVFHTSFHHMNSDGFYDGWTDHTITVKPSLAFGIVLSISGRNRNDIKDYIHQAFEEALTS